MKIHEYQARQLLQDASIAVPPSRMVQTVAEAHTAASEILSGGAKLLVVQPLMADRTKADGDPQLAIDTVAAGVGDLVMITSDGRLGDYKSTREAHPLKSFAYSVKDYGYGLSAALYEQGCVLAGIADPPMHFVVSSTVFPYETQVLTLPSAYMDYARRRLDELLTDIAERRATGNWLPDGYGRVCEIEMPGYGARGSSVNVE
jgi:microcompartment protein CcmK/EutM